MRVYLTLLVLFALMCPMFAAGAQSQQQSAPDEPLKLTTDLVVVDAQILNKKSGAVVGGLALEDFSLYEDGIKQQVTHFSQDKLPLSIVFLLDVSGSVMPIINRVRDEGLVALAHLKQNDEIAVMIFGKWAEVFQDFTSDRQLIAKRVGEIRLIGPWIQDGTDIHEAVYQASRYLAKASNPGTRRVIIIVTDNIPNYTNTVPRSQPETLASLMESGASLFGLVVGDFAESARDYASKGWLLADSIGKYVNETGGIAVQIDKDDAIVKLEALVDRLRTRYSFGYTPKNQKRDGKFRRISLKILPDVERREGAISIIARSGYYAQRP